jgi:type I restriction-modification system DNA methylase subunit
MNLAANAYAIGPSLHDDEREEWEEQEIKRDIEEERLNADFRVWEMFTYCDKNKENGKKDIEDKMSDVLDMIASDETSRIRFNWLLFNTYCSDSSNRSDLVEMIRSFLIQSYKKEWDKEQEENRRWHHYGA